MKIEELTMVLNKIEPSTLLKLKELVVSHRKIIILGNGGSSSIASHISQDYTKKLGKCAFTFSDSSRLTCYINDYGMELAYRQFLQEFSETGTLVILISSSGNSANILNCADYCKTTGLGFITVTGFDEQNLLRRNFASDSLLDVWVDSKDYGVVECAHQVILHVPA